MKQMLKRLYITVIVAWATFTERLVPVPYRFGQSGAVVAVKSQQITNADATPMRINPAYQARSRVHEAIGAAVVTNGDSIGSTYRVCRIRSNDRVSAVFLDTTAITTCAGDIGLYRTQGDGGAVVDADFFASAQSLATALRATDVTRESGVITIPNMEKRVWEQLGLAADPGVEYDVAITLTAAAGSGGDVALRVAVAQN
jgi:hypothetical protein